MPRVENIEQTHHRRIASIVQQIGRIDLICSGTLTERRIVCGKANCRCATDPAARHGPYYEWTWTENGKFMHKNVSAQEAKQLQRAIDNQRAVKQLLKRWERESAATILKDRVRKS